MKKRGSKFVRCLLWLAFLVPVSGIGNPGGLTLVALSGGSGAKIPTHYQVLKDYLGATLYTSVEIVVAPDLEEVVSCFQKGNGDLFIGDLEQAVAVASVTGSQIVLSRESAQGAAHQEVILAGEHGATRLDSYKGGVVGLRDDSSLNHFYMTRAVLAGSGISLEKASGVLPAGSPVKNRMQYVLHGSDGQIMAELRGGRLDLGVVNIHSIKKLDKLKVLDHLPPISASYVVFSPTIDTLLTNKIRNTMIYMDADSTVNQAMTSVGGGYAYRKFDKETFEVLKILSDSFALRR